ncbi:MAG: hypothetical protein WBM32_16930 [Crocosphaera sp.]
MNNLELQQQINQELSKISSDNLKIIAEFVKFIKHKQKINDNYKVFMAHSQLAK